MHSRGAGRAARRQSRQRLRHLPTVFRAALVQTSASVVLRFAPDGRYPSLRFAAPPSPGGVRHVHAAFQREVQQPNPRSKTHEDRHIDSKSPSTKQEIIAVNIKLLIEQLECGQSEALINYLSAMSHFHNYLFGTCWRSHGRCRPRPASPDSGMEFAWPQREGRAEGMRILVTVIGMRRKTE